MSIGTFFKSIGRVLGSSKTAQAAQTAGAVVAAFNPGLGALVELIANAAYSIETSAAGASGSDKKDAVKQIVDVAAPVAVSVLSGVSGKPVDPTTVAPAIDSLIDTVVALLNALGVFTHKAAATTAPVSAAHFTVLPAGEHA